jgi:hypothetical protein
VRNRYDAASKWLIETFAAELLQLAGVGPVTRVTPLPSELVQSRQLPDGLLEVVLPSHPKPVLHLIEVNTYSYTDTANELLDDVVLTYLNRRVVPEVIAITLNDRGHVRVAPSIRVESALSHARLEAGWRVINLWELDVSGFLPLRDPGMAPWVPLMKIDGPPEPVLQQCKDAIDTVSEVGRRENLLNFTQILAGLRWDKELLKAIFAKEGKMIESPVLQEWFHERDIATRQKILLESLESRFSGPVPPDVSAAVRVITDEDRLKQLLPLVFSSSSLDAFRQVLTPLQAPATTNPTN